MIELINMNNKRIIENKLFKIIKDNNFKNIFKNIPILFNFFECYRIIENERILINKIIIYKNVGKYQRAKLIRNNMNLINTCKLKNIYLDAIVKDWGYLKNMLIEQQYNL